MNLMESMACIQSTGFIVSVTYMGSMESIESTDHTKGPCVPWTLRGPWKPWITSDFMGSMDPMGSMKATDSAVFVDSTETSDLTGSIASFGCHGIH